MPCLRSNRRPRGFVLVAVLWVIAALALLVAAAVYAVRIDTRQAFVTLTSARAEALLDGALTLAAAELAANPQAMPTAPTVREYTLEGERIQVDILRTAGFISLNSAPPELLQKLFQHGAGLDEATSRQLAACVVDWRDADDTPQPDGAEAADYLAAGLPPPRNGEFLDEADLAQVLGITADVHDRIRPLLIAEAGSGAGGVNAYAAEAPVLTVLADGNAAQVARLLEVRERFRDRANVDEALTAFNNVSPPLAFNLPWVHPRFRLRAHWQAPSENGAPQVRWLRVAEVAIQNNPQNTGDPPWQWFNIVALQREPAPAAPE